MFERRMLERTNLFIETDRIVFGGDCHFIRLYYITSNGDHEIYVLQGWDK